MNPRLKEKLSVRAIVCVCVLLCASAAAYAMPPQRIELTFSISFGAMKLGEGRDVVVHNGKRYKVVSETIPKGVAAIFIRDIRRESVGTITEAGLRPDSFHEYGRKKGIRAAEFDWSKSSLRLVNGDTNSIVALPQNSIDQASLPYGFAFIGGVPKGFSANVADGRRLKEYSYRIVGRERIETVLGEIDTVHLERVRAPDDDRSFDFWISVDHYYLPVKMKFTEKGRTFDSIVTSITYP